MKITVKHLRSWGNDRYYPICDLSKLLCILLKRKSLTLYQLETIEKSGFNVIYEQEK